MNVGTEIRTRNVPIARPTPYHFATGTHDSACDSCEVILKEEALSGRKMTISKTKTANFAYVRTAILARKRKLTKMADKLVNDTFKYVETPYPLLA